MQTNITPQSLGIIGDMVSYNERVASINDVQLSWYPDDPRNALLANQYQFTRHGHGNKKSSIDVLQTITDNLLAGKESRYAIIATYGHGKTHYALSLANLFGKSADALEVQSILKNIAHAANEGVAAHFRGFKESRKPFLMVRLDGSKPGALPANFCAALSQALAEHPETTAISLPFWSQKAEAMLDRLGSEQKGIAEAYLNGKEGSLASLRQLVREHRNEAYHLCRSLSEHLYGNPMDFGSEVDLKEAVKWAVEGFVDTTGDDKPFGGLLVLFDEFTLFVESYFVENRPENKGALQNLLDGINTYTGRAAFVALSQYDPYDAAERALKRSQRSASLNPELQDSLQKILNRIPLRFNLHSSLETVLDAYLDSDNAQLGRLKAATDDLFYEAANEVISYLPKRYEYHAEDGDSWGPERVEEVIASGCFPLHPLTTGLLCTLSLQNAGSARGILWFVREMVDQQRPRPAVITCGNSLCPNWVFPIRLVDFYGDALADESTEAVWEAYERAKRGGAGALKKIEEDILKAVLLQSIAQLPLKQNARAYARLIATLTGHSESDCQQTLTSLTDQMLLDHEPSKNVYRLIEGGRGDAMRKLREYLDKKIQGTEFNGPLLQEMTKDQYEKGNLKNIPVAGLSAGNAEDFAAEICLLPLSQVNAASLRAIAAPFAVRKNGIEGKRGAVVYIFPQNDKELFTAQDLAKTVLRDAFGNAVAVPLILCHPSEPQTALLESWLRLRALEKMGYHDTETYGKDTVKTMGEKLRNEVVGGMSKFQREAKYYVSPCFEPDIAALPSTATLSERLQEIYRRAYGLMPPSWKANVNADNTQLRKGVSVLGDILGRNALKTSKDALDKAAVGASLEKECLRSNAINGWTVTNFFGDILLPSNAKILKAWEHLNETIGQKGKRTPIVDALIPLLNPPYGYDYNTLTLLLCAWWGMNRDTLRLLKNNASASFDTYLLELERTNKPKAFIDGLCYTYGPFVVERVDADAEATRAKQYIAETRAGQWSVEEAEVRRTDVQRLQNLARIPQSVRDDAAALAQSLTEALTTVREYETGEGEILLAHQRTSEIKDLMRLYDRAAKLPTLTLVRPADALTVDELKQKVFKRLKSLCEERCAKFGTAAKMAEVSVHEQQLKALEAEIGTRSSILKNLVNDAHTRLSQAKAKLEAEEADAVLLQSIVAIEQRNFQSETLASLRSLLADLQAKQAISERASSDKKRVEARLAGIIQQREQEARQFVDAVETVADAAGARRLETNLLRVLDLFDDTPEGKALEQVQARLDTLTEILPLLQIETATLRTLEDVAEQRDRLNAIQERDLTPHLRKLLDGALACLNEAEQDRIAKAEIWLQRLEAEVETSGDFIALHRKLETPPNFLPAASQPRLQAVCCRLREREDADQAAAVAARFSQIQDPAKRRACLESLAAQEGFALMEMAN